MKYSKAMGFDLHLTEYTRMQMVHLLSPIRVYDGKVYVLDDVATMEIGDRDLIADEINSELVYFAKGDGSSGVSLQGDRGPSGARGLKGDSSSTR